MHIPTFRHNTTYDNIYNSIYIYIQHLIYCLQDEGYLHDLIRGAFHSPSLNMFTNKKGPAGFKVWDPLWNRVCVMSDLFFFTDHRRPYFKFLCESKSQFNAASLLKPVEMYETRLIRHFLVTWLHNRENHTYLRGSIECNNSVPDHFIQGHW